MAIRNFDNFIRKSVRLFVHPVWFVTLDKKHICPCVDKASNVPNKKCPICFGTGHKIKLIRVMASNQNARITFRGDGIGFSEKNIVNVYYTEQKTPIKEEDIIIDHNDIDVVNDVYYERSDSSDIAYWRIETTPYKYDKEEFKKLFLRTIEEAGYIE